MTPNVAVIRIEKEHGWFPPIPIPIFLLWIPVIFLAPFVLLVLWAVCLAHRIPLGRTLAVFWDLLCGLPGTQVRVVADGKKVSVRIL